MRKLAPLLMFFFAVAASAQSDPTVHEMFEQYRAAKTAHAKRLIAPNVSQPSVYDSLFIIPIAGNAAGGGGTYFRSDLLIRNNRTTAQEVSLGYFPANQSNAYGGFFRVSVPGSTTITYRDVVGSVFGRTGLGAIVVVGSFNGNFDPDAQLHGFSRIWTPQPGSNGTVSQSFPALSGNDLDSRYSALAIGGRQDGGFRSNVGIFNISNSPRTFQLAAAGNGSDVATLSITVPAYSVVQVPMASSLSGDIRMAIAPFPGEGFFYSAYVSSVDNFTGDSWSANFVQ